MTKFGGFKNSNLCSLSLFHPEAAQLEILLDLLRDLIYDTLLLIYKEGKEKAQHQAGIKPKTSQFWLPRHVLCRCATTDAQMNFSANIKVIVLTSKKPFELYRFFKSHQVKQSVQTEFH